MKIFVITHKDYFFPKEEYYVPLQVGTSLLKGKYIKDSQGENISELNSSFCELTALYWIWKNASEDIVGLVHYRRYFSSNSDGVIFSGKKILGKKELLSKLESNDIIISQPRNYFIFSIRKHYCKAHAPGDLDKLKQVVHVLSPEYDNAFETVMSSTKISLYNMLICRKEVLNEYCSWLFPILFELKNHINYEHYDSYQKRVFGFLGERLFNVWLYKNKDKYKQCYVPVTNIEGENLLYKGFCLFKRHFLKREQGI